MRIIGGRLKGKAIEPPQGYKARPTTDFAKEGLFNILNNEYEFEGLQVLDLFGGTGSISFEFASRGASMVYCVEMLPLHANFIKSQVAKFGLRNLTVVRHNVFEFLEICHEKFDIIFSSGVFHYITPNIRIDIAENLKQYTNENGVHAINVFVEKS